ncbi:MAG: Na+/H+ antiporter NhaA [Sporocytophaga sp.]|nr:Na+/H+ antiporter NhaA [Sporocytophaga sp.]
MKKLSITKAIKDFVQTEQSGGIVLICCAIIALFFSNTSISHSWFNFWEFEFGFAPLGLHKSLLHWVNDGLMDIFFFW